MCSKDKFNTPPKITQLEIKCFGDNTKNYFQIMVLVRKEYRTALRLFKFI